VPSLSPLECIPAAVHWTPRLTRPQLGCMIVGQKLSRLRCKTSKNALARCGQRNGSQSKSLKCFMSLVADGWLVLQENNAKHSTEFNSTILSDDVPQHAAVEDASLVGMCQLSGTVQDCCKACFARPSLSLTAIRMLLQTTTCCRL